MTQQLYLWAFIPEKWRLIFPEKSLYMNVYSIFIYNTLNWKQPRCPSMDKKLNIAVVHPYYGTTKKEWNIHTCHNLYNSPENLH